MDERDVWLEWRRKKIGSSDAPIIMGASPWSTPLQLWEVKTGRTKGFQGNWATDRGNELEPRARAAYELEHGTDMPASLVEHPTIPFLAASLDGYNADAGIWLEIKCPGKDDHALALEGKIPEKYLWQLAHQGMACQGKVGHYWSFDGFKGVLVEFQRDPALEEKLLEAEEKFWKLVQSDTPPELTPKDYKKLRDEESKRLFESYRLALAAQKHAEEATEAVKAEIMGRYEESRVWCNGLALIRSERKGAVDYAKIPELKGVDLEKYRKKPSLVASIREVKFDE